MNRYLSKVYQEDPSSAFTHDGKLYKLNPYLRKGATKPVVRIPISELSWVLKYDTPSPERVSAADISKPVLVTRWNNRLVVVDGLHRLARAIQEGSKTLPCKILTIN